MKKLNHSNFEHIEDIIKELDFKYSEDNVQLVEKIAQSWEAVVGDKISKFTKVGDFSNDNLLTIICSDSFVANELYFEKDKLLNYMNTNMKNLGTTIKDIKFNYRKWKEEK